MIAISAVMGSVAYAGTITGDDATVYNVATNGTETGATANTIATYQATEAAIETAWNNAEAWIGQELGYDTTTTDAHTALHAAGFTANDFLGAVTENKTAIAGKQDALTTEQLAAANSGITADKVSTYDGYATSKQDALTTTQLAAANSGITADKVSTYDGYATSKQDALTTTQLAAANSGITADKVSTYDGYATSKQDALTTGQLAAVNSGITADKVSTYDGYATSKQDTLTTEQLAAVNSGITAELVGQITTNKNDINTINNNINVASNGNYITAGKNVAANLGALDTQVKANADNIGNLTYANNAAVNYNAIAANTNLTTAVSQIASNIGAAATGTNGNVLANNTVNANLDRIDSNMGNLSAITNNAFGGTNTNITGAVNALATNVANGMGGTFATNGTWSATIVNNGAVKYQNNVAATSLMGAVNQVASNIGTAVTSTNVVGLTNTVNQNLTAIDTVIGDYHNVANTNGNLSGTDLTADLDMIDTVIGNRAALTSSNAAINNAVATDLSTAFNTTGNLIGDMDFTGTNYVSAATSLSDAVRGLDTSLRDVEHNMHKIEYNMKSGLAAMSALSALVPNARDCGNTQVSVGTGVYSDRVGVALGGFHYFNDHVLMNLGASYGGTKDWAFRAGVTFGIGM